MAAHVARENVSKTRRGIELLAQRTRIPGRGADDSATTVKVLDQLGPEWQRIDDIRWPGKSFANVDHVLVGPPGIFVIDTREWSRSLDAGAHASRRDNAARQAVIDGVAAAAHAVGSLLGMTRRRPVAILCFVGKSGIDKLVGDVLVCSTNTLMTRLQSMDPIFDAEQIGELGDQLRTCLIPVTGQFGAVPTQRAR